MKDSTRRAARSLLHMLVAAAAAIPIMAASLPTPPARIAAIVGTVVGIAAAVTHVVNALEDKGLMPAFLKAPPSAGADPVPNPAPGQTEQDIADPPTDPPATVVAAVVRTVVLPERQGKGGRLGRHVHHDERSRAYRVTPVANPRSVTWKRHVAPFDQGSLGSCTGNAMAGALSTAPFRHRFGERRAVSLYEAATRLDDVPGSYPPDDTGSSGLAVAQAAKNAGLISSYNHCFNLDDVIAALQSGPVIAGTNWHAGMDTPDASGLVTVKGAVRGGHEYEILGVDLERKLLIACNSWGTSYGVGGYFSIGFDDFTQLLAEQGDVTVPVV